MRDRRHDRRRRSSCHASGLARARLGAQLGAGQSPAPSQAGPRTFPTSDAPFKTRIDVNRWHGYDELVADMERLQRAFPKFLTLSSIGKSVEGRDIMVMTIINPDTGAEATKAGMYIEANVHGNEIQGAEVCLYTIWYLMEHYDRLPRIKQLVDERVFYIVPTVNPDGREHFLQVHAGGRSGHQPVDNDNDGVADEDDVDDLNGNGVIEQMRKLRARAGDAPHQRPRSAAARAGAARHQGRLRDPRLRGARQRRRRPRQRGRARRLRPQPQLGVRLAAELRPERIDGLSVPAARGAGRQRASCCRSRTSPACSRTTTPAA